MNDESHIRYSRLAAVEEIGKEGVRRLSEATVAIVGCGALGSMVAMQLAASGIGSLRLIDFDSIDISNLQRQLFFQTSEAGLKKVEILRERILALNPSVNVAFVETLLTERNGKSIIDGVDVVVEATDNPSSMSAIDRICEENSIPCIMAGVNGFFGQVLSCLPGSRRYSDLFPTLPESDLLPCSIAGVTAPPAAIAASIQTAEVIKYVVGIPLSLADKILLFDLRNMSFNLIST
ncbi:MAG: HesA/MoeB/ThiF family protein [Muribaculaceae bacterium]|nr:HesA/MoeB/ThiF family protein [Muribaculaceae bacterium]